MTIISDDAFVRLFQERFGLEPVDGWAGPDTVAMLDSLKPPAVDPVDASGIPDSYWPMLSKIESGDQHQAKGAQDGADQAGPQPAADAAGRRLGRVAKLAGAPRSPGSIGSGACGDPSNRAARAGWSCARPIIAARPDSGRSAARRIAS